MENRLDKLFHDKLVHATISPPAAAWEKIKNGFPPKNKDIVWAWRIAATILLLTVPIWLIDQNKKAETQQLVKIEKNENTALKESIKELKIMEQKVGNQSGEQQVSVSGIPVTHATNNNQEKIFSGGLVQKKEEVKTSQEPVIIESQESPTPVITQNEILDATSKVKLESSAKTITLVYNLEPVKIESENELIKERPTTLRKAIDFAMDVKSGETTLGTMRGIKDDFFALDLKKRNNKSSNN